MTLPSNDISIVADPSGQTSTYDVNAILPSLSNYNSFELSVQEADNANTAVHGYYLFDSVTTTPAALAATEGVATQFNFRDRSRPLCYSFLFDQFGGITFFHHKA